MINIRSFCVFCNCYHCTFYLNQLVLHVAMLLAKNQRSQAAQAMHELGNLQYHASNIRYIYV